MGNKITCNSYVYQDGDVLSGNCFIGNSLAAEELSIDTLDVSLNFGDGAELTSSDGDTFITSDGYELMVTNPIADYKYGDVVEYEYDNEIIGKFYLEKPLRTGKKKYDFSCISAMGLLDGRTHFGGIYDQEEAGDIIADIMGDIPYAIYTDVETVTLSGWLPKATCRANLHQVLFAIGAGVFKDTNGDMVIRFVGTQTPYELSDSRIYINGTVDYKTPCTKVNITEHAFAALASDTVKTLFETTDSVTSELVVFDTPCHDLTATGLTIVSSGVNYAIVSGTGSLTGKEYTHTKKVVSYTTTATGAENIATVADATLVSVFNSYNVALRVAQYYSEVATSSIGLVVGTERPTDVVAFNDPFGDATQGYIKSMDINLSNTLKADTEIAVGFVPTGQGNNFNHYVILTGSGTWTPPAGVTRLHEILVGGGKGGHGGYSGGQASDYQHGGVGGLGGELGTSGKIFVTNATVTPLQPISYSCGTGGTGGSSDTAGADGGATTFGSNSSADGIEYPAGYVEPKSGLTLGGNGVALGLAGGNGSSVGTYAPGTSITYNGTTYTPGTNGTSWSTYNETFNLTVVLTGGGGGGPAITANGNNGGNAVESSSNHYVTGAGGNGASSTIPGVDATNYGQGGSGGHGGGGGGASGVGAENGTVFTSGTGSINEIVYTAINAPGVGGAGSSGGDGGDGCIIIYY